MQIRKKKLTRYSFDKLVIAVDSRPSWHIFFAIRFSRSNYTVEEWKGMFEEIVEEVHGRMHL